ncbi:hypothetical protein PVAP13_5KG647307 [Panicum virgatum]|uniref:Uncharacterized protein n=1 Tax=Panicum virgatum TaxID=38727 RepID=A0A8T0SU72_PANVG|nr:hypothetical protein PVAP13_5KG647307 [Panicum virgatum]
MHRRRLLEEVAEAAGRSGGCWAGVARAVTRLHRGLNPSAGRAFSTFRKCSSSSSRCLPSTRQPGDRTGGGWCGRRGQEGGWPHTVASSSGRGGGGRIWPLPPPRLVHAAPPPLVVHAAPSSVLRRRCLGFGPTRIHSCLEQIGAGRRLMGSELPRRGAGPPCSSSPSSFTGAPRAWRPPSAARSALRGRCVNAVTAASCSVELRPSACGGVDLRRRRAFPSLPIPLRTELGRCGSSGGGGRRRRAAAGGGVQAARGRCPFFCGCEDARAGAARIRLGCPRPAAARSEPGEEGLGQLLAVGL